MSGALPSLQGGGLLRLSVLSMGRGCVDLLASGTSNLLEVSMCSCAISVTCLKYSQLWCFSLVDTPVHDTTLAPSHTQRDAFRNAPGGADTMFRSSFMSAVTSACTWLNGRPSWLVAAWRLRHLLLLLRLGGCSGRHKQLPDVAVQQSVTFMAPSHTQRDVVRPYSVE